jgi:hypothetical protein
MASFIEGKIFDKTKAKWQYYQDSSSALARYLRPIMLHVDFILMNHKSNLPSLMQLLKNHYLSNKNPGSLKISSNTSLIKEKSIINHFVSADKKEKAGIRFGKIFCYHKNDTYNLITQKELLNACKIAVAGTEGQKVLGLDYTAYAEDEQEALMLARKIVLDGIDEKYLPKKILQEKYMQAYTLVQDCKQEMRKLLTEHKAAYNKLVTLLERRKTIRIDAIKECFGKDLRLIKASYTAQQVPLTFSQEPLSSQTLEFTEEDNDDDDQEQALQEQSELEQAQAAHYKLLQDNQNSKTEYA